MTHKKPTFIVNSDELDKSFIKHNIIDLKTAKEAKTKNYYYISFSPITEIKKYIKQNIRLNTKTNIDPYYIQIDKDIFKLSDMAIKKIEENNLNNNIKDTEKQNKIIIVSFDN